MTFWSKSSNDSKIGYVKLLENEKKNDEEPAIVPPLKNDPKKNIVHFWKKINKGCDTTCRVILGVSGVCLISFTAFIVLAGVLLIRSSNKKVNQPKIN